MRIPRLVAALVALTLSSQALLAPLALGDGEADPEGAAFACRAALSRGLPAEELRALPGFADHYYSLDEQTLQDVDADALLAPVVGAPRTPLGQGLLKASLAHPTVDPAEIRQRQSAVREIRDQATLRDGLGQAFAAMPERFRKRARNESLEDIDAPDMGMVVVTGMGKYALLGLFGFLVATAPDKAAALRALPQMAPMLLMFGSGPARAYAAARAPLVPIRELLRLADRLGGALDGASSPRLRNLKAALSAATDPAHPDSVAGIKKRLDRMPLGAKATILDVLVEFGAFQVRRDAKLIERNAEKLLRLFAAIAEADLFLTLGERAAAHPEEIFPEALDASHPVTLEIVGGHSPFVREQKAESSVGNDLRLGPGRKFMILTGPNAGGKSTHLRMAAHLLLLAQLGGTVPAQAMAFTPMRIRSAIGIKDSLADSQSRFQAESSRIAGILQAAEEPEPVLFLLDEMLSGTNAEEGGALGQAAVEFLAETPQALTILATHDRRLTDLAAVVPGVYNRQVLFDDGAEPGELAPTYRVGDGRSERTNAVEVARQQGFPARVIARARELLGRK